MGEKLKAAREKMGLSVRYLAKISGVSRMTIYKLEKNRAYMASTRTLTKLAKALGKDVEDIFFTKSA